ncbi:putative Ufm1-specific protease [Morella rubra]|uniref:Putative Ufm1-specific protease n=1 Tax=Morella rubra TaxID=262757 RepID=A0A6A1UST8_9ROSI|nr:putative Ufm1-specific protease [Morella rubra]
MDVQQWMRENMQSISVNLEKLEEEIEALKTEENEVTKDPEELDQGKTLEANTTIWHQRRRHQRSPNRKGQMQTLEEEIEEVGEISIPTWDARQALLFERMISYEEATKAANIYQAFICYTVKILKKISAFERKYWSAKCQYMDVVLLFKGHEEKIYLREIESVVKLMGKYAQYSERKFQLCGHSIQHVFTWLKEVQALVERGRAPSLFRSREWFCASIELSLGLDKFLGVLFGSHAWLCISIELRLGLDKLLGVTCKVLNDTSGVELLEKCIELAIQCNWWCCCIYLLGVEYNETSGDCQFLILDPHYIGNDDLKKIENGGESTSVTFNLAGKVV